MPWIGPLSKLARERTGLTGTLLSGSRLLLAERAPAIWRAAGALAAFLLEAVAVATFLLLGVFELDFFWLPAFLLADFPAADFARGAFFLVAVFLRVPVLDFFLVAELFREVALRGADFRAAAFLPVAAAFFRLLLAVFFAGIFNSCGTEKRRGLYMASSGMEARF